MNFENIDINNITIDDKLNIKYKNNKLIIKAPVLYLPFGIDYVYNNIIMKLQMKKYYYKDNTYDQFTQFIEKIEERFKLQTNMDIKTQLDYNEKFGNIITTKVLKYNNLWSY